MIEENIPEGMQPLLDLHRGECLEDNEVEQDLPDEPSLDDE